MIQPLASFASKLALAISFSAHVFFQIMLSYLTLFPPLGGGGTLRITIFSHATRPPTIRVCYGPDPGQENPNCAINSLSL